MAYEYFYKCLICSLTPAPMLSWVITLKRPYISHIIGSLGFDPCVVVTLLPLLLNIQQEKTTLAVVLFSNRDLNTDAG